MGENATSSTYIAVSIAIAMAAAILSLIVFYEIISSREPMSAGSILAEVPSSAATKSTFLDKNVERRRKIVSKVLICKKVVMPSPLYTSEASEGDTQNIPGSSQRLKSDLWVPATRTRFLDDEAGNSVKNLECPICLKEYSDGEEICWSSNDKCTHVFHFRCLEQWLINHSSCPICRGDYLCSGKLPENEIPDDDFYSETNPLPYTSPFFPDIILSFPWMMTQ